MRFMMNIKLTSTNFINERAQISHYTKLDRYPILFKFVSSTLKKKANILSFGCSRGDEVATLSGIYFDQSTIVGVDIVPAMIKKAKRRVSSCGVKRSNTIRLMLYEKFNNREFTSFDCIFAMSVFCRWPDTENQSNISNIYDFSQFERMIKKLDRTLRPGGYLIIFNSNYYFEDTSIAHHYLPINSAVNLEEEVVHRFNVDGSRHERPHAIIFRKRRRGRELVRHAFAACSSRIRRALRH
jgi:SAM-dependent methyltransferase